MFERNNFFFVTTILIIFVVLTAIITMKIIEEPQNIYQNEINMQKSITAFPSIFSVSEKDKENILNNSYETDLLLFGIFPVKKIGITILPNKKLIPCGQTFGIKFFTKGVMIVGMSDVKTNNGDENPAYYAGIRVRDIILAIDDKSVNTIEEVSKIVEKCEGKALSFYVKRNISTFIAKVTPKKSSRDELFKIGAWIRDSTAGIGTITYIDPQNNSFAGLGHGICDVDTGDLLPLNKATIFVAQINSAKKGENGEPGELKGIFLEDTIFGELSLNTEQGIFGKIINYKANSNALNLAFKQEIKEGNAQIISTVNGTKPEYFNVEIIRVYRNGITPSKNMIIKIIDKKLLSITGGIVQGMSGSPIIQNGKLIGAVTHVLVNDPTKGFGIFIENMLEGSNYLNKVA